jgi:hypothetical protein
MNPMKNANVITLATVEVLISKSGYVVMVFIFASQVFEAGDFKKVEICPLEMVDWVVK